MSNATDEAAAEFDAVVWDNHVRANAMNCAATLLLADAHDAVLSNLHRLERIAKQHPGVMDGRRADNLKHVRQLAGSLRGPRSFWETTISPYLGVPTRSDDQQ